MSKMDYATLAVVAFCITALVVLTYRVVNLGKTETTNLSSAISSEPAYKDPYNDHISGSLDDSLDQTGASVIDTSENELVLANTTSPIRQKTITKNTIEEKKTVPEKVLPNTKTKILLDESAIQTATEKPTKTTSVVRKKIKGQFLVITGTFRSRANAQNAVKQLKKWGFIHAEVGFFNKRTFASALAGRYTTLKAANAAALNLRQKYGIDAIVKKKQ